MLISVIHVSSSYYKVLLLLLIDINTDLEKIVTLISILVKIIIYFCYFYSDNSHMNYKYTINIVRICDESV